MKLEPAVAAEHGDALEQIVQRFPLDLEQGVVRAFERQAVGDVLVHKNEAAQRMRRYRHAQRAIVRQVHQLALRLDQGGEHLELLALEGAKVGVFRNAAALAQPLQEFVERWLAGEPVLLQSPQPGKRRVVKAEPLVGTKDRDRGVDAFEDLAMRVDVPRQFAPGAFKIGLVDGEADRPRPYRSAANRRGRRVGRFGKLQEAARPGDDDMVVLALDGPGGGRAGERQNPVASGLGRELAGLGEHRLARQIERRSVRAVAIDDPQVRVAAPDRDRQHVEHRAHGGGLAERDAARLLGAPDRRYVGKPHHAVAACRPTALDPVDRAAAGRNRRRERRAGPFQTLEPDRDARRIFALDPGKKRPIGEIGAAAGQPAQRDLL